MYKTPTDAQAALALRVQAVADVLLAAGEKEAPTRDVRERSASIRAHVGPRRGFVPGGQGFRVHLVHARNVGDDSDAYRLVVSHDRHPKGVLRRYLAVLTAAGLVARLAHDPGVPSRCWVVVGDKVPR